jgi:riboflavin transporter FmnP
MRINTQLIINASIFGALSIMFEIIPGPPFDVRFPLYPNISWDLTGVPMMLSLLLYGPLASLFTCLIGCSIIFMRGNLYGGILKIIAELSTLFGYALFRRNFVINSLTAIVSRVTLMSVANFYLLQLFYGMSERIVASLIGPIAVFNASQALINIFFASVIYEAIRKRGVPLLFSPQVQQIYFMS